MVKLVVKNLVIVRTPEGTTGCLNEFSLKVVVNSDGTRELQAALICEQPGQTGAWSETISLHLPDGYELLTQEENEALWANNPDTA